MDSITEEELLRYNQLGLIPGPGENEIELLNRAKYCLSLRDSFETKLTENAPFSPENRASAKILEESFEITQRLYDIKPDWIPVFFSNYKLAFWHGGCAWIFQENEKTPMGAFFQLRQVFRDSTTYLGIYRRDELIAHELSHVGRMMFEEQRFEEVLAYRSDHSRFRRYFGPIMQSSWESALFVLILFLIIVTDFSLSEFLSRQAYQHIMWLKLVPFGMVLYALGRLWKRQRQSSRCLSRLQDIVSEKADAVIYRLTDEEIGKFAEMTSDDILKYAEEYRGKSLRWKVIYLAYFMDEADGAD